MLNISCFNFVIPAVCVVLGHLMAELPTMYIAVQYRPNRVKHVPIFVIMSVLAIEK